MVALRKSEEIERQREGKVLAQGNREVAELNEWNIYPRCRKQSSEHAEQVLLWTILVSS